MYLYTTKLLVGYMLHNRMCFACNMPMMKHRGKVKCVICVQDVAAEEATTEAAKENAVVLELQPEPKKALEATQTPPADASIPAKKVSTAATQPALVTTSFSTIV